MSHMMNSLRTEVVFFRANMVTQIALNYRSPGYGSSL